MYDVTLSSSKKLSDDSDLHVDPPCYVTLDRQLAYGASASQLEVIGIQEMSVTS